jgi:enoyl-CoA hydratase
MDFNDIIYEKDKEIARITLNRPEVLNAVRDNLWREMEVAVNDLKNDNTVRVLIITGTGRAFSVGEDLKEAAKLFELRGQMKIYEIRESILRIQRVTRDIIAMPKPAIAAVNGYALGAGAELAMLCDIRIASEKAQFGFPEVKVASFETNGSTYLLPRLVGLGKAKELMMTGDYIDAAEALRIGLVERVVSHEGLMDEARSLAEKIANNAPLSVALVKQCLNKGSQADLETALVYETEAVLACIGTDDMEEGAIAFVENRPPRYQGK